MPLTGREHRRSCSVHPPGISNAVPWASAQSRHRAHTGQAQQTRFAWREFPSTGASSSAVRTILPICGHCRSTLRARGTPRMYATRVAPLESVWASRIPVTPLRCEIFRPYRRDVSTAVEANGGGRTVVPPIPQVQSRIARSALAGGMRRLLRLRSNLWRVKLLSSAERHRGGAPCVSQSRVAPARSAGPPSPR
jgi:hypothetical protein